MTKLMQQFALYCLAYLAVAIAVIFVVRDAPVPLLIGALQASVGLLEAFAQYLPYFGVFLLAALYLTRAYGLVGRVAPTIYALVGCFAFSMAFSMLKTSIPFIQPFYADPFFAQLDRVLHFGVDPYVWAHRLSPWVPANAVAVLYFLIWSLPAVFLPMFIALTDADAARARRFLILYAVGWIGLGNIAALMGSSVGPVYYDRLLGGTTFADLITALQTSGISASKFGMIQDGLWHLYAQSGQSVGSGISAFPSVHVALSCVTMLYLAERSRILAPVGFGFLIAILFCSVYNGWHYAVDGYASIAVISGVWAFLRRRNVAFATTLTASS